MYKREYEKKFLLTEGDFRILLNSFSVSRKTSQTNFYYDTDHLDMNSQGITCRIREENGTYIATIKEHKAGDLECSIETSMIVDNQLDDRLFEGKQASLKGSMTTERYWLFEEDGIEVVLDKNMYLGHIDYEVEVEYDTQKVNRANMILEQIIMTLVSSSSLYDSKTKSERFFQIYKEQE